MLFEDRSTDGILSTSDPEREKIRLVFAFEKILNDCMPMVFFSRDFKEYKCDWRLAIGDW